MLKAMESYGHLKSGVKRAAATGSQNYSGEYMKKILLVSFVASAVMAVLFGCAESNSPSAQATATGKFIDAPVAGLTYISGEQSGTTAADGSFTYEIGNSITFSVGAIVLGTAPAKDVITPVDLAPIGSNITTPEVLARVQFLMSVSSTDPSTGTITIPSSAAFQTRAAASRPITWASSTIQADLETLVTALVVPSAMLVTPTTAKEHLTSSIVSLASNSYSGKWAIAGSASESGTWTITIDATGNFSGYTDRSSTLAGAIIPTTGTTYTIRGASSGGTLFPGNSTLTSTWEGTLDLSTKTISGTLVGSGTNGTFTGGVAPAAPTGVTATPGNGAVNLSWTPYNIYSTYFNIYWSTTPGVTPANGTKNTLRNGPLMTSIFLPGFTNGTTYYFVVTEENGYGESTPSSEVSVTPIAY